MSTTARLIDDLERISDWLITIGVSEYLVDEVMLDAYRVHGLHDIPSDTECTHLNGNCNCS